MKKLFTSESVGAGHPDKICDQIADAILDKILKQDENARVAIEVMATNKQILIGGQLTTSGYVDFIKTTWEILFPLGYDEQDFAISENINKQSKEISSGVDKKSGHIGAGDQGIMFGYAINETPEYMPLPIIVAHKLLKRAEKLRREGKFKWAKSDMKSQVTIDYSDKKNPKTDTIIMSIQHDKDFNQKEFKNFIEKNIIKFITKKYNLNGNFKIYINPAGNFTIGGTNADSGLTGRKIIVDSYGGKGHSGGGSFSGKDYTKVDRSGAYAARWVAKNLVAAKLADEIEIQLSYGIGIEKPISIAINAFDSEKIDKEIIHKLILKTFDLTPKGIIKNLDLKKPIYLQTATFGHFGRDDLDLPWEKLNKVKELKNNLKNKNF